MLATPRASVSWTPRERRVHPLAVARLLALILLAIVFLVPLVWLFLAALKTQGDLSAVPIMIVPPQPEWVNFQQAFTFFPWFHYAWNSLFLSTTFGVLTVVSSAVVGFGFARLKGRGKNVLFMVMLSTIML